MVYNCIVEIIVFIGLTIGPGSPGSPGGPMGPAPPYN